MKVKSGVNVKAGGKLILKAARTVAITQKLVLFVIMISLASCYTSKGVNYLQSENQEITIRLRPTEYTVQPNDVLDIKVQSRDPDQASFLIREREKIEICRQIQLLYFLADIQLINKVKLIWQ